MKITLHSRPDPSRTRCSALKRHPEDKGYTMRYQGGYHPKIACLANLSLAEKRPYQWLFQENPYTIPFLVPTSMMSVATIPRPGAGDCT